MINRITVLQDAPSEPEAHRAVKREIERLLAKMKRTNRPKELATLSLVLVRLWRLVYPTG